MEDHINNLRQLCLEVVNADDPPRADDGSPHPLANVLNALCLNDCHGAGLCEEGKLNFMFKYLKYTTHIET